MSWLTKSPNNADNTRLQGMGKQLLPLLICAQLITAAAVPATAHADSDYEAWRQQTLGEFKRYLDENDKAFLQRLQKDWKSVDLLGGEPVDSEPKPQEMPKAPEPVAGDLTDNTPQAHIQPDIPDRVPSMPEPPVIPPVAGQGMEISFYGYDLKLPYSSVMQTRFRDRPGPQAIASYYETQASADYKNTIDQLQQWRNSLQLSDWATAQLVAQFCENVVADETTRTMLNWFLMLKMGFDARLAYNDKVWLLLPADEPVYEVSFFTLDGTRYYALPLRDKTKVSGSVSTYAGQYKEASQSLHFDRADHFTASGEDIRKRLSFYLGDDKHEIEIGYPLEQIAYLDSLPQLDLKNYPNTDLPAGTRRELLDQLRPLLQGKTEEEAVNTLLIFVQTAFAYETDEQQFRRENYLYPLETLHYPASDCEDRASLFALLVHELLGLSVALTDYPGHVAAAVAFSAPVKGDHLTYNGTLYTITDPTYINARAGMTMPEFAQATPSVIPLYSTR